MEKHHSATDFKRQNMNFAKRIVQNLLSRLNVPKYIFSDNILTIRGILKSTIWKKRNLKNILRFFFFLFYLFSHVNRIPQLICPINSVSTCYRFHRGIAAMTTFHLITFQRIGTSAIIVGHLDSMTFLRIENFLSYLFLFVRATNFLRSATVRHVFVTVYIDIVGKF